jgi:hypothetical protein
MALNTDKIDDTALALLYLTLHDDCRGGKEWIGAYSAVCTTRA